MMAVALAAAATVTLVAPRRSVPSRVAVLVAATDRPSDGDDRTAAQGWSGMSVARGARRVAEAIGRRLNAVVSVALRPSGESMPDNRSGADIRLGTAVLLGLAVAPLAPVLALPIGVAGWVAPWLRARSARRRHQRQLIREVPAAVELFRLAVGAGLSVHLAVAAVASRLDGLLAEALSEVIGREAMGEPLADALDRLSDVGSAVRPLVRALVGAERYGTPLGATLDRVALESRLLRRRDAEEAARRLPVLLLFPLVVCILPAFGLLTVVPLLAASLPHLSS
jgi:tight adherence protein C